MARISRRTSVKDELRIALTKEYRAAVEEFAEILREEAREAIKEDRGGLINSISVSYPSTGWQGGRVSINVPYASYVNDGRGEIVPKHKKMLSNQNTSAPFGHTLFFGKYAGPFGGYHFVERAIQRFEWYTGIDSL